MRTGKNTAAAALVKGNRPASGRQTTELQRKGPQQYPRKGTLQQLHVCPSLSTPAIFLPPPTPLQEAGKSYKSFSEWAQAILTIGTIVPCARDMHQQEIIVFYVIKNFS